MQNTQSVNPNAALTPTSTDLETVCNRLFNDIEEIHNKFCDVKDAYDLLDFTREFVIDNDNMAYLPQINTAFFNLCDKMASLDIFLKNVDTANKTVNHLRDALLIAATKQGAVA